jgi:hypothetical protein
MMYSQAAPLLIGAVMGLLVGVVSRGVWQNRKQRASSSPIDTNDWLWGLLAVATFALGAFVAYVFTL